MDRRIVDLPRILWLAVLQVILLIRPTRSAKAYKTVWTEEGSPLYKISKLQLEAIRQRFRDENIVVELGMRYGNPSIASALRKLQQANARRILVLPLYPQYSSSTTASTFDAVAEIMKKWRWVPEFRFVNQYHDHPEYIRALAGSIREAWQQHQQPEKLVFSFHGTPKRFLLTGDPYFCQCQKTARLVAEELQLKDSQWMLCFQSIFGREEWLKPYTIDTLQELAGQGTASVDVVCPGFSADCLETLEEIEEQNKEAFLEAGGKTFHYIPALNDRADHIDALSSIIRHHSFGWEVALLPEEELASRRQRAVDLGARE